MQTNFYVGVDIGGTSVKIAIINQNGEIFNKWEIPTRKEKDGIHIPKDIWNSIEDNINKHGIDKPNILGIGVGAPGFVNINTGNIAIAVNIGWNDFDLGYELESLSQLPVYVENDANIAALGENWKGAGNLDQNLIAITLGTGVGGGIIVNGQVINGVNGTAGEIGHLTVEPGGALCNCGRNGCLETVASATGIVRQANEIIDAGKESKLLDRLNSHGDITSKDVFEIAKLGDKEAKKIVDRVVDVLGLAIANAATLINPSKVVIGGGVSKAGDQLIDPLKRAFDSYTLPRISDACEFAIAKLGNDAGVIGGAFLVKRGQDNK